MEVDELRSEQATANAPAAETWFSGGPLRILLLHDEPRRLGEIEVVLAFLEHEPVTANVTQDWTAALTGEPGPHMVMLGECGGGEALDRVFDTIRERCPQMPIVLLHEPDDGGEIS